MAKKIGGVSKYTPNLLIVIKITPLNSTGCCLNNDIATSFSPFSWLFSLLPFSSQLFSLPLSF